MLKSLFIALCFTAVVHGLQAETIIEDFNGEPNIKWIGQGDSSAVFAGFEIKDNALNVTYKKSPVNSCWVAGQLLKTVSLENHKSLSFRARSTDGQTRQIGVLITKSATPNEWEQFISYVDLTPEWQFFRLNITDKTGDRAEARKGRFIFTKGSKNSQRNLSDGGVLTSIVFASSVPGPVSIDDIAFDAENASTLAEKQQISEIEDNIAKHPTHPPYEFASVIASKDNSETPLILADEGKTDWVIVVPEMREPVMDFAAGELKKYLGRATGAEFNIVNSQPKDGSAFILEIKTPSLKNDGFTSNGNGQRITITANNSRSLTFAVYDFLEKAVGIRFFMPFDFAEVVPLKPMLRIPPFADRSEAVMNYRCMHYCSNTSHEKLLVVADWNVKNRFNVELERLIKAGDDRNRQSDNVETFYRQRGGRIKTPVFWGHNFHYFLPPEKYYVAHPDFYPLDRISGKRIFQSAQLCTTNPGVINHIAEQAREYFRANPEILFFPVKQEDGTTLWCQCDNCLNLLAPHRRYANGFDADRNIYLANAVYNAIKDEFPDRKIVTYAYSTTATLPDRVFPAEGVYIEYCIYSDGNPDDAVFRTAQRNEIEGWIKLTGGQIIAYTYNYTGFTHQFRTVEAAIDDFRYFALNKIDGSYQESAETWGINGYLFYLSARLAWDPWFDTEAFKTDYFTNLYGPAATPMLEFFQLTQKSFADHKNYVPFVFKNIPAFTPEEINRLEELQRQAETLATNTPRAAKAVAYNAKNLEYITAYSAAVLAGKQFLENITQANYQTAMTKFDSLEKAINRIAPELVTSYYDLSQVKSQRESLKMTLDDSEALTEMKKKYRIISRLSTPWKFAPDKKNSGESERWFAMDYPDQNWSPIKSGDFWENQGFKDFDGIGWYRTSINIPATEHPLTLYFGGADERAWVYLDGNLIGEHQAGNVSELWKEPFYVQLPNPLSPGIRQLTVKVIDTGGGGGLWKDVYLVEAK